MTAALSPWATFPSDCDEDELDTEWEFRPSSPNVWIPSRESVVFQAALGQKVAAIEISRRAIIDTLQVIMGAEPDAFWTVAGLADRAAVGTDQVTRVLEERPDLFRRALVPDPRGRAIFTLASNRPSRRERWARYRLLTAKTLD